MSDSPLISIIIPVYNVSDYICTCLDSIIAQKTKEAFEIILVDDGSTDGSSEICDEYAARDKLISVIHKENGGASDARNVGIRVAIGKYILFIDGDDYICAGSIEKMIKQTKKEGGCDVTFLNADIVLEGSTVKKWSYRYKKNRIYQKNRDDVLKYLIELSHFPVSPCIKLLKRSFVIEKNIFFTKGIVCEDVDHTYKILLLAETFNYYDFNYYYARIKRKGSVMTSDENAGKRFDSTLFIITKWIDVANKNPVQKDVIFGFLATQYLFLIAMYNDISTCDQVKNIKMVTDLSWLLNYGVNKRFIFVRIFYKIFKLKIFSKLLKKMIG